MTRKMIAGMIVIYASMPATLSVNPPAAGAAAGAAPMPGAEVPGDPFPHLLQKTDPSSIVEPQLVQNFAISVLQNTAKQSCENYSKLGSCDKSGTGACLAEAVTLQFIPRAGIRRLT